MHLNENLDKEFNETQSGSYKICSIGDDKEVFYKIKKDKVFLRRTESYRPSVHLEVEEFFNRKVDETELTREEYDRIKKFHNILSEHKRIHTDL